MKKYTVQIIGGGLAGLSLATCLGKKNIPTLLIDNQPKPEQATTGDRRTTALMESSVQYFENLGVWDAIKPHAYKLNQMKIIQINPQNKMGDNVVFDASNKNDETLAYNTDNHEIRKMLCDKISTYESVEHIFSCNAIDANYSDEGWIVDTTSGQFVADLSVGCDGRNSIIRKSANISVSKEDYNQSAIVFNVNHTVSHNNSSTELMYPEGAFTFVPMGDNCSAIVWVEATETAKSYVNDHDLLYKMFVKKAQGLFGDLEIITDIQTFPLNQVMAKSSTAKQLCLMGEAHHGLTPVAAQGLNLSLRDSAVLAQQIVEHYYNGKNVGSDELLKSYANKRKNDIQSRAIATRIFHKVAQQSAPISLGIKTIGINLFNRIPVAKKAIVNAGVSFPGGIPQYMKKGNKI